MSAVSPTYLGRPIRTRISGVGYAALLATGFSVLFFTNLPTYGGMFLWPAQPIHFLALLGLAMFPLLLGHGGVRVDVRSPFVLWCLTYLLICSAWYAYFGGGASEPFEVRVLAVLFMLTFHALFVHTLRFLVCIRYALIVCVLAGVAINAYDITHPFVLVPSTSEFSIIGRAAGLYVNPNPSGLALLMGFVLTVELLKPGWRPVYAIVVLVGIVLTASRAGIVGMGLVLSIFVFTGVFRFRQLVWMSLGVIAGGLLLWNWFGDQLVAIDVNFTSLYERATWFVEFGGTNDFSQRERVMLAEKALALLADHPLFGAGLGATELWDERTSTHNMYLMTMADFGLFGLFIFPALVCASVGGIRRVFRRETLAFSCLALWAGMVSHNLIGEYYFMISLALMAAQSDVIAARQGTAIRVALTTTGMREAH